MILLVGLARCGSLAEGKVAAANLPHRVGAVVSRGGRPDLAGDSAILVDDGIATRATMRAALRATRMRNPKRLVLAVPVGPTDSVAAMREEADNVVCLWGNWIVLPGLPTDLGRGGDRDAQALSAEALARSSIFACSKAPFDRCQRTRSHCATEIQ